jgi:hypothetical protein
VWLLLAALPVSLAAADWQYRVRPGDNLWDLCRTYLRRDVPWERVQSHNRVDDPFRLRPGSLLRFPIAWLQQQPASARIVALHGEAVIVPAEGAPAPAGLHQELGIGTVVRTSPDASLTLLFADGSRLLLAGDSELALDRLSAYGATGMVDTRLRLPRGRTTNAVKKASGPASRFSIETPDVVASVRGTDFRVASEDGRSRSEVLEGRIEFSAGDQRLLLEPGEGAVRNDDGPSGARPLLPAPDAASITVSSESLPARVHWAPVAGAVRYRVQLADSDDFLALRLDTLVEAPPATLDGIDNGTYALRVRAVDEDGLEGHDAIAKARIAVPPPFTIEPVAAAALTAPRPRLRWGGMGEGVRYHLQLAATPDFRAPLLERDELTATDLRVPEDLAPGEYAWRVAAVTAQGQRTAFSDAVPFRIEPAGSAPPPEAVQGDARGLHLRWPAGAEGVRYRVQVSRKADFSRIRIDREVDGNAIFVPEIRSGRWYARIAPVESDGYTGPFGPAQELRLGCAACRWLAGGGGVLALLLVL